MRRSLQGHRSFLQDGESRASVNDELRRLDIDPKDGDVKHVDSDVRPQEWHEQIFGMMVVTGSTEERDNSSLNWLDV